ncbi:MAG: zinc-ribbon domain-containing protein [Proteobacteria bacterium]|nr:zinc-ribbon domain-containing protein [Pseudomonadota bacterium]
MKITCGNCGAKYSIADEKVRGKVFKIRCKKCSESIVVRGDELPPVAAAAAPSQPPEAETKVFDYSGYKGADEALWHVVASSGEQMGPYSINQLGEFIGAGSIDYETFIWREGFADWQPLQSVEEVMSVLNPPAATSAPAPAPEAPAAGGGLFDAAPAAAPAAGGGLFDAAPAAAPAAGGGLFDAAPAAAPAAGGGLFDTGPDEQRASLFDTGPAVPATGGGLFDAAPAAAASGNLFDAAPAISGDIFSSASADAAATQGGEALFGDADFSGGGDLFAGSGDSGDSGGIFASTEAPSAFGRGATADASPMTGARNENSVLFSLANLQALASGGSSGGAVDADLPSIGGFKPGEEASGLIDIRAMASTLAAEAQKASDVDDMLSIGGGGFTSSLGAPILAATPQSGLSMGAKIGIGAGVVLLLAALVVLGVVLNTKEDTSAYDEQIAELMKQIEQMKVGNASPEQIAAMQAQLAKTQADKEKAVADKTASGAAAGKESDAADKAADDKEAAKKKTTTTTAAAGTATKKTDDASQPKAPAATAPAATKKTGSTSALDSLLAPAKKPDPKPQAAAPAAEGLTRAQVSSGMNAVKPSVERCGAGKSGSFKVRATIDPSGRVTNAQEIGDFAGTPAGTCAANAVKRARFPASSKSLTVTYPFKLP